MNNKIFTLFAIFFLSSCNAQTHEIKPVENLIDVPSFNIEIILSPNADSLLKESKETITVDTFFYGFPKEEWESKASHQGIIYLSSKDFEKPSAGIYEFKQLTINDEYLHWINDRDYFLHINLYTSRKSSKSNLISCGKFDDHISVAIKHIIKIECKLIGE